MSSPTPGRAEHRLGDHPPRPCRRHGAPGTRSPGAGPLHRARATDPTGPPSAFIDRGSAQVFRGEDGAYATALWHAGAQAELRVQRGGFQADRFARPNTASSRSTGPANSRRRGEPWKAPRGRPTSRPVEPPHGRWDTGPCHRLGQGHSPHTRELAGPAWQTVPGRRSPLMSIAAGHGATAPFPSPRSGAMSGDAHRSTATGVPGVSEGERVRRGSARVPRPHAGARRRGTRSGLRLPRPRSAPPCRAPSVATRHACRAGRARRGRWSCGR